MEFNNKDKVNHTRIDNATSHVFDSGVYDANAIKFIYLRARDIRSFARKSLGTYVLCIRCDIRLYMYYTYEFVL